MIKKKRFEEKEKGGGGGVTNDVGKKQNHLGTGKMHGSFDGVCWFWKEWPWGRVIVSI